MRVYVCRLVRERGCRYVTCTWEKESVRDRRTDGKKHLRAKDCSRSKSSDDHDDGDDHRLDCLRHSMTKKWLSLSLPLSLPLTNSHTYTLLCFSLIATSEQLLHCSKLHFLYGCLRRAKPPPEWPDSAKFHLLGEILKIWCNFLRDYFVFAKILIVLGQ